MRNLGYIFALAVFGFLGFAFWELSKHVPEKNDVDFGADYQSVVNAAKVDGKPIILIFTASWCGPCQQMKKNVYPSIEVSKVAGYFHWLLIDVDDGRNRSLTQLYGVNGIPHIEVIDSTGRSKGQSIGGRSPSDFAAFLNEQL